MWQLTIEIALLALAVTSIVTQSAILFLVKKLEYKWEVNKSKADEYFALVQKLENERVLHYQQGTILREYESKMVEIEKERQFQQKMMSQILSQGKHGTPVFIEEQNIG